MPDYIYLLENRLSADQQNALRQLREAAREAGMILFLTGDAVRDLTSGHAVRELEVSVHGNALKLQNIVEKLGGKVWGESETSRTLYLCFAGTVQVDVISTQRVEYPKPGKAVYYPASIQEDLRRRDFTVNAMSISLNEGSFGLLMDPLNGAADIEAQALRLVSNYGFLEEPSLLIRATRYRTRLGWELDSRTRTRYENAKNEGVIEHLSDEARSRELEQIGHEEEGLKVLRALEDEGWMKYLFPAWTAAKADEEKLKALHDLAVELLLQGVHADVSAAQMQLLTAKLASRDLAALKKLMLRPGFVEEWNSLDAMAARFAKVLMSKENAAPSAGFKLFTSYDPEAILWLGFASKDAAVQERFNQFLKVWPETRQRIPHAVMQEMRITPELAAYREILQGVFLELLDGRLTTAEELRAFLEPHSPPAPPPQLTIKRPRVKRGAEAKLKERSYDDDEEAAEVLDEDGDLDDLGGDEDDLDLGLSLPKVDLELGIAVDLESEIADDAESVDDELEVDEPEPVIGGVKGASKVAAPARPAKEAATPVPAPGSEKAVKSVAAGTDSKTAAAKAKEAEKAQPTPKTKPEPKPGQEPKPEPAPGAKPAVAAKPHETSAKAKAAPAASPAKETAASAVKKAAPAPVAAKESKEDKSVSASPAAAKSAAKPQAKSEDISVKPPQVEAEALSVKPPQAKAQALSVKPPQAKAQALSVKPPQAKAQALSVKPLQLKAKAISVKPPTKVPAKAAVVKAAPVKGKPAASKAGKASQPAKASKPAAKKPAPKPAKKR
jgi:tRNA nucleotidyltransferase/poly(A) polymerase